MNISCGNFFFFAVFLDTVQHAPHHQGVFGSSPTTLISTGCTSTPHLKNLKKKKTLENSKTRSGLKTLK